MEQLSLAELFLKVTLAEAVKVKESPMLLVLQVGVELGCHQFLTVVIEGLPIPEWSLMYDLVLLWPLKNSISYLGHLFNQFLVNLNWGVGLLSLNVKDEDILRKLNDVMFLESN